MMATVSPKIVVKLSENKKLDSSGLNEKSREVAVTSGINVAIEVTWPKCKLGLKFRMTL